ncbi:MAG: hypothetical protein ACK6EB_21760 [Planctomyces sp.]
MSQKLQQSLFRPAEPSATPDCRELQAAVDAAVYELEKAETTLRDRLFLLLDCQKGGLSQKMQNSEAAVSQLPAYQALTELKTVSETVLDLKDYLGISKQDAEE